VPLEFAAVVKRMMAKRPEDRFPSARELRETLLPWAGPTVTRVKELDSEESSTLPA
jgi:hypothetical protein